MPDLQIPWMDMDKFWEIARETSVVRMNLSDDELQEIKNQFVVMDEKYKDVTLSRFRDFVDLFYSVFTSVKNYHTKYGFSDEPVIEKEVKQQISLNNKVRHKLNKLRPFASIDEKVKWHIDHVANCKCWPMPRYVKKEIEKRMK